MQEINIKVKGFVLDESTRMHIMQRLHSVFGFDQYEVRKIVITLFNNTNLNTELEKCCDIKIMLRDQPSVVSQFQSLDILTAVTLAIERAHLKMTNCLKDERSIQRKLNYNINKCNVYSL